MKRTTPSFREMIGRSLAISLVYCISLSVLITLLTDLYLLHHYTEWTFVAGIAIGIVLGVVIHRFAKRHGDGMPPGS